MASITLRQLCVRSRLTSTHGCSNLARYTGMTFGEELDASETQGLDLPAAYAHHRSRKFGCAHSCWLHNPPGTVPDLSHVGMPGRRCSGAL